MSVPVPVPATAAPPASAAPGSYRQILRGQPALMVIMLSVGGHMVMNSAMAPMLSLYARSFGVTEVAIGLAITVFGIGRLLADIPAGLLAERHGRRIWLWTGPAIAGIASVGAGLTHQFEMLVALRLIQGIGSGIYMTAAAIVCADISTPATRGRVMALYQAAVLTGTGLGPAIGGLSADWWAPQAPFWICAAIGFGTSAYVLLRMPETRGTAGPGPQDNASAHGWGALAAVVAVTPLLMLMLVNFSIFFSRAGGQWTVLPLLGHARFALGASAIGLALALSSFINLLVLPWAGTLGDRFGQVRVIAAASGLTALALLLVAWAPNVAMFWLGTALMGVGGGLLAPAVAAYAANHAPNRQFGATMGVLRFGGDLGLVCGPLLLGGLIDLFHASQAQALGLNALLVGAAASAFTAAALRVRRPLSSSHPPDPRSNQGVHHD